MNRYQSTSIQLLILWASNKGSNNTSGNDKELNAKVRRRVGVYMRQYLWQYQYDRSMTQICGADEGFQF